MGARDLLRDGRLCCGGVRLAVEDETCCEISSKFPKHDSISRREEENNSV